MGISFSSSLFDTYAGVLIGRLPTEQHQVSGNFYIVDLKTLFFEDFNYDQGRSQDLRKGGADYIKGRRAKRAKKF